MPDDRLLPPRRRLSVHPILHPIGGGGSRHQTRIMQRTHLCAAVASPIPCLVPGSATSVIRMAETPSAAKAHQHLAPFESPVDPQLMVHLFGEQHPSSASSPPFPHGALERFMVRVCVGNGWIAAGLISPFSSLLSIAQPESERGNSNYIKFVYLVLFQLIQSNSSS